MSICNLYEVLPLDVESRTVIIVITSTAFTTLYYIVSRPNVKNAKSNQVDGIYWTKVRWVKKQPNLQLHRYYYPHTLTRWSCMHIHFGWKQVVLKYLKRSGRHFYNHIQFTTKTAGNEKPLVLYLNCAIHHKTTAQYLHCYSSFFQS